ncbi:unnamed protein product [Aspergillus oryzae var. brunneus]|nr:unnamed protein product [Aspergillus oryzae]GMG45652.1 unnamed protein product [Aspergillus oryzae var. brunneus]
MNAAASLGLRSTSPLDSTFRRTPTARHARALAFLVAKVLMEHQIDYKGAVAFDEEEAVKVETGHDPAQTKMASSDAPAGAEVLASDGSDKLTRMKGEKEGSVSRTDKHNENAEDAENNADPEKEDNWRINNLVSNIGMVSVQGTSDPRYLGSTSGISFARVVFAAVKSSVPGNASERGPMRPSERLPHSATGTAGSTGRDSFFGLQTRPMMKCAAFPERELAEKLSGLYFEHANPQIPILHRNDFMELLDRTYAVDEKSRSPRSLYMLNIVFAIGAGIIFEDKPGDEKGSGRERSPSTSKRPRLSNHQYQPEEYHASAIIHLESFVGAPSTNDGFGALEELQAVLLLANFALLRPVAPGLWYIVGVAMRLAVDLGLHYEDGTGIDTLADESLNHPQRRAEDTDKPRIDTRERGRREWVRDLRRRLWWCVYSFDRLVSCCVGRPFGISDQAISTEFPSLLEDQYITKSGIVVPPEGAPSYKHAAHHYFKLRVLQSEIQDVLQHQQSRFAKHKVPYAARRFTRSDLISPFLQGFDSFRSWRKDIHRRLIEWQQTAPTKRDTGVQFSVEFLELNYWQAVIMLYQQSLTVPAELADEVTPAEDVSSPSFSNVDEADDEDDIYYKVAEAGQKRMSKATVQMSLSTTGFGSQVDLTRFQANAIITQNASAMYAGRNRQNGRYTMDQRQRPPLGQSRRQTQTRSTRPIPRFDMNLGDLFNDNSVPERHGTRRSMQSYSSRPEFSDVSSSTFASERPNRPQRTPSMEYYGNYESPVSPQTQQQYVYGNSPQHSGSPSSVTANPSHHQFQPTDQEISSTGISLDFLDFDVAGTEGQVPLGSDENPDYDLQAVPSLGHGAGHSVGIDLGFGMAVDFQHDWSENANYDLLEGYFFGGSGAGPSADG